MIHYFSWLSPSVQKLSGQKGHVPGLPQKSKVMTPAGDPSPSKWKSSRWPQFHQWSMTMKWLSDDSWGLYFLPTVIRMLFMVTSWIDCGKLVHKVPKYQVNAQIRLFLNLHSKIPCAHVQSLFTPNVLQTAPWMWLNIYYTFDKKKLFWHKCQLSLHMCLYNGIDCTWNKWFTCINVIIF